MLDPQSVHRPLLGTLCKHRASVQCPWIQHMNVRKEHTGPGPHSGSRQNVSTVRFCLPALTADCQLQGSVQGHACQTPSPMPEAGSEGKGRGVISLLLLGYLQF